MSGFNWHFFFGFLAGCGYCWLASKVRARIQRNRDERLQRYQDGDSYNEAGR